MTQLFNISIDGVDVTYRFDTGTVSEEMNRIYDVATFTIDDSEEVIHEKEVVINYGSKTFTGFIYSVGRRDKKSFKVEARTYPAKLTEPYSPYEVAVDDAVTSHELCALYASRSGIPITITSSDLDFGGSYERSGTMLNALLNVAAVTGAEYYDENGTVMIAPNKAIEVDGEEIPDSDIFDFVADSSSIYNKGVGYITIRNGGDVSSDIISMNKIYAEVDECTGEVFVYPNPNGVMEHTKGVSSLSSVILERKENFDMLDEDVITLKGAVESIASVTLNGVSISDYNFEQGHNVLYFTTLKRGTLEVVYNAYCYKGYANVGVTPIGRFISFDLYYLDQVLLFQGFLSPDCANVATDGDMTCIVPKDMYYNMGFDVWTIGGSPSFMFYDKSSKIIRAVTSTAGDYVSVEDATLEAVDGGGYRYRTRYLLDSALGARSANENIDYTISIEGEDTYFELTQYYPKVSVSYTVTATNHTVQFAEIPYGDISMVIVNDNTGEVCEYDLEYKMPCELNQNFYIDVAAELGLEVVDISGTNLSFQKPDQTSGTATVDDFGFISIYMQKDGDYVVDTSSIKPRTTITLTVNTAGV